MSERAPEGRAILSVYCGPAGFRKAVLRPGDWMRVGRAESAEFSLPHDAALAEHHFELGWDGQSCVLNNLDDGEGTRIGGERRQLAELRNGAWIRAGHTDFILGVEGSGARPGPINPQVLSRIESLPERRYALLDAARGGGALLSLLRESVDTCQSLYEGVQGDALLDVAPYLVELSPDSDLIDRLMVEGWGRGWGVFASCPLEFKLMRRHLRRLLLANQENSAGRVYFRFYDPRVLAAFLDSCSEAQARALFGPIQCFICEADGGELRQLLPPPEAGRTGTEGRRC